ncbi:uncharacterized protein N7484_005327 [Penicillium longicatenatum]|uniref:uncharacterized protein n=1 Tax=Penicillium longicatenatum TaxID=1561947 RepID=UPI002548D23B|nr:uncharacterized protein N7484_005327 [Penicillium longicatenatum]KAJ5651604.1 hypothetical protein N7484_005327 [Penicillium longicatenatum]
MPFSSRWSLDIPDISIPSFIFGSSSAAILPDKGPLFIDAKRPDINFTHHSYREFAKRLAVGLIDAGLKTGDRVMLFSGNHIFSPIVIMGTVMAGGVYNSTNPGYMPHEVAYQLKTCQPTFLLVADNCLERALKGADMVGFNKKQIYQFGDPQSKTDSSIRSWAQLIASPERGAKYQWEELNTPESSTRTAILIFSSGTTGLPKGVEISHRNLVANVSQLLKMQTLSNSAPDPSSVWRRRGLCCLPMYHALGLTFYNFVAPKGDIQVYIMERYKLDDVLQHIQDYKISELVMVPPMVLGFAKHPQITKYDLKSVRKVMVGAAPLGIELTAQFESIWNGDVRIRQVWGMSEQPCMVTAWHEDENNAPASTSVGELLPGCDAMLMRPDGTEETRPNQRGEIWIRGPNMMKGYWNNATATKAAMTDGWLMSGDIAYFDEKRKFYIVDRIKELIKVRGAQVAPAELEALLLENEHVRDAAVIGVKTATEDEDPRAYIVPEDKKKVAPKDIESWINSRVSKQKRITGGVLFVDSIPKNPSGKILRRFLREHAAKDSKQSKL